jgi:hypothetical protein
MIWLFRAGLIWEEEAAAVRLVVVVVALVCSLQISSLQGDMNLLYRTDLLWRGL